MTRAVRPAVILILTSCALFAGCSGRDKFDPKAEAPPPVEVERESDARVFSVDHPEQFPLISAVSQMSSSQLTATGVVAPDVSRTIPVVSLASGRVVDIRARIGDSVKKGQLLMRIRSSDISSAFADYQKAGADEALTRTQMERSRLLYEKGAISLNDFQVAQDAENKAGVDLETSKERLRLLGGSLGHPSGVIEILAPISGVIVEQNVTAAAGVKSLDNSPNLFTIADLSWVWILCDVYENDLGFAHVGDDAEIRVNAYPGMVLKGRISNMGPILDPILRTAKVRIEVRNPGTMRLGMFVTATFHGQKQEIHTSVPTTAVLHLHDRDWVFIPTEDKKFQRVEISIGNTLPGNMQEVISGIKPGIQVIQNALVFQNAVEQ